MVKINERYDDIVSQDPAYQGSKPVDAVNEFMSKFIGQPIKKKLESKEQALYDVAGIAAKPLNYIGSQISSDDVTLKDLQKTATTDQGLTGLLAQIQMPFEALGETLEFVFDPQYYADLKDKVNRGEATGLERTMGVVAALGELAGGEELLRFAVKKFGPGIRTFFDNLSPEEKADPIAVINKMPISKQQKVELGQEILGGGKTVENIQETIMRSPADEGAGGSGASTTKTTPYSYLEADVKKYLNTLGEEDIASPSGLLKYLKANNKQLNVENKYRNELSHVTNALNEFKGKSKIFTGYVNPWMIKTSEILNNLDNPIHVDELAKLVEDALPVTGRKKKINAGNIRQWLKGNPEQAGLTEKGLNNLIVKNDKYISKAQGLHFEVKDQLEELLRKLENGEIEKNLGYKNYPITLSDGTTKKLEDLAFELKRGQKRDLEGKSLSKDSMYNIVGIDTIEQILPQAIKLKGGETVVDENLFKFYIPEPTKQTGNVYQQNLQFLKDLYRPGGMGVFKDFEELAKAYGIQKVLPNDPDAKLLRTENQKKINELTNNIQAMLTSTKGGEKAFNKNQLQAYRQVIDESLALTDYNKNKFIETLNKSPELKEQLIDQYTQYYL